MILVEIRRYFSPFETIIGYYEGENEQIPNTYSQYANMAMETLLLKMFSAGMEKATGLKIISCLYLCKNL